MGAFDRSVPVADGDLLVMSVEDVVGRKCGTHTPEPSDDELALPLARAEPDRSMAIDAASKLRSCRYLLASFHGDTNGLATLPVLDAVHKLAQVMHCPVARIANVFRLPSFACWYGVADNASPSACVWIGCKHPCHRDKQ